MLEFLMELVLEGSIEIASSKKVPMAVRVLLAALLLSFYTGLVALLLIVGIRSENIWLVGIAFIVFIGAVALVVSKVLQIKKR